MASSKYFKNKFLNEWFNQAAFTFPTTIYIGLFTANPNADGESFTEVSGGDYARQAVVCNDTNFPETTDGVISNAVAVPFPQATASWGTVVGVGIFDASSAGNLLIFAELTNSRTVNNGDTFDFPIDSLEIPGV